jgi:hypothetical protein
MRREETKPDKACPVVFVSLILKFEPVRDVWLDQSSLHNRLNALTKQRSVR